jgi:hypothetical protein
MPYQGRQPGVGVRGRFVYTATGGQTTFSGADSNGRTLSYQDGAYVDVYLNGVMLVPTTDFTATTKTSIALTSGATASDIVEILAYDISSIADTVSALNGGTFAGSVVFDGAVTFNGATTGAGGGLFKGENGEVGSSAGDIFRINEQTLNTSVTIDADENASATGPLTIASGVTLTVTSGGNLSIV